MSDLPSTIKYPDTFKKSPAAGFDGTFDWSWTQGCFGGGKITPMDFDGVVERKGNFIVFETKGAGVPIPEGQILTLKRAHELGVFTVMFIHGKATPEAAKIWCAPGFREGRVMQDFRAITTEKARDFVSAWYDFANSNPRARVDVSFLNKRIYDLQSDRDVLANKIATASGLLNKALEILAP